MYSENPAVIKVAVTFKHDLLVKDYTAKLVKSLLIVGNPKLEEVFSRGAGQLPKPIHITPLYTIVLGKDGRERNEAVYARLVLRGSTAKPPSAIGVRPTKLEAGREYFFYVGASATLVSSVLLDLSSADRFFFGNELVAIDRLQYEVRYVEVEREARNLRSLLESPGESYIKVVFESPTLLKDPLAVARWRKRKLFVPLPEAVLATPLLMVLHDKGRLRWSTFLRCARYVKSVLDIPYTALRTVNIAWYVYNNKVLPAMIGYAKYFIDREVLRQAQAVLEARYGLDFLEILSKTVVLAQVYGVGDGRAAGFGHTSISVGKAHTGSNRGDFSTDGSPADGGLMAGRFGP